LYRYTLASGELLCAWFSGDSEGGDGVAIVVARLLHGSHQWTVPEVVSQAKSRSAQNPVMFLSSNKEGTTTVNLLHTSQVGRVVHSRVSDWLHGMDITGCHQLDVF
jgi:predicted neuraminidase